MSRAIFQLFEGEKPTLDFEIVKDSDGTALGDLTGYTPTLVAKRTSDGEDIYTNPSDVTTVIQDGPAALVRSTWTAVIAPGKNGQYRGQIKLQAPASGEVRYTEIFDINVDVPVG